MRTRHAAKRAFTLIEILIVVVILGILAAIVIPQFTSAAEEAQESSVHSQLQTVRSQIELWNMKNPHDRFTGDNWDKLLNVENVGDGNRYLQAPPRNAMRSNATDIITGNEVPPASAGTPGDDDGWYWNTDENILYAIDHEGNLVDCMFLLSTWMFHPSSKPALEGAAIKAKDPLNGLVNAAIRNSRWRCSIRGAAAVLCSLTC
jgi:general secretion pathway protein G